MADLEVKKIGKIEIDRALCIGAATCLAVSPDTFELDNEAKAVLKNTHGNTDEEILDSAKTCPTKAIKLFDESGKQMYP
jgi:ferredoxin